METIVKNLNLVFIIERTWNHSISNMNEDNLFSNEGSALPIYFTVLIVIILSLITYVLMQLRIKRMLKLSPNVNTQQTYKYPAYNYQLYRTNTNQSINHFKQNHKSFTRLSSNKEETQNTSIGNLYFIFLKTQKSFKILF